MQIVNIIVTHPDVGINSVESFGVLPGDGREESVEAAEECFINTALKYEFGENFVDTAETDDFRDDCNDALEDGYIDAGGHLVSIVWSSVDNLQI